MRQVLVIAGLVLLGAGLSGCGFTPLYANPRTVAGLGSIEVVEPQGRLGHLLHEDLDDAFGRQKGEPPAWRLELALTQTRGPRGLSLQDVSRYYDVGLTVQYTLRSTATGKVAASGAVSTQVSYDDSGASYADIAAAQDAQGRVAADAARRIQLKLAAWMSRAPSNP